MLDREIIHSRQIFIDTCLFYVDRPVIVVLSVSVLFTSLIVSLLLRTFLGMGPFSGDEGTGEV